MSQHSRITKGLREIGAAWAVRSDKYLCTDHNCCNALNGDKPAYHIHPDASYPHQSNIMRFRSMADLEGYIKARKAAAKAKSDVEAHEIMQDWAAY